jgi:redox-sensitive bicupin YhaK (pirin superfamily)
VPIIRGEGKTVRVIAGSLYGEASPVETLTATFYADAVLEAGARIPLPADHEERAVYVVQGKIDITGDSFEPGQLLVFRPGDEITIAALEPSRLMLLGGEPMDGPRHIWWNFVSSSKERIEQAKADWKAGRFSAIPDETEFIPLPDR